MKATNLADFEELRRVLNELNEESERLKEIAEDNDLDAKDRRQASYQRAEVLKVYGQLLLQYNELKRKAESEDEIYKAILDEVIKAMKVVGIDDKTIQDVMGVLVSSTPTTE